MPTMIKEKPPTIKPEAVSAHSYIDQNKNNKNNNTTIFLSWEDNSKDPRINNEPEDGNNDVVEPQTCLHPNLTYPSLYNHGKVKHFWHCLDCHKEREIPALPFATRGQREAIGAIRESVLEVIC